MFGAEHRFPASTNASKPSQCRLCGTSSPLRTFEPCEPLQPIASAITRTGLTTALR
jgi:hypothetical protein